MLVVWVEILLLFSAKQIKTPKFDGTGYLSFTMPETKSIRHITSFSLEMKTTSIDGMILWIGQDLSSDDYLGVGIRKGMVHLVWNLGWFSRTELTIPSPSVKINDGDWHSIKIHRVRQSIDVEIDGEVYNSRVTGSYYELNTANSVLLGNIFYFTLHYYLDTHGNALWALVESKIVTKTLAFMIKGSS